MPSAARLDLPLFSDKPPADDAPLISAPAVPRTPLSVRRAPPPVPKPKIERTPTELSAFFQEPRDADVEDDEEDRARDREFQKLSQSLRATKPMSRQQAADLVVASAVARLAAGLFDVVLLASIDAAVLYFTLRVLGLTLADAGVLPPIPLAIFLGLLNGGYLATFTAAGGQTIGKMLTGIRVVAEQPGHGEEPSYSSLRVPLGAAVLRAAAYLVSLLPAGLGFAAILLDKDGRALHDRLANTRVVKA